MKITTMTVAVIRHDAAIGFTRRFRVTASHAPHVSVTREHLL